MAKKIEEVGTTETVVEKKKKKFASDDGIMCHSIFQGKLFVEGKKSGNFYEFESYGASYEIEYQDMVYLARTKSPFLFAPYIIIDDDDFIEEFVQLKKFYDESYTTNDLYNILNMPVKSMISAINALPESAKNTLKNIASTMIADGSIDSIKRVKALDEVFETDLEFLSTLFK